MCYRISTTILRLPWRRHESLNPETWGPKQGPALRRKVGPLEWPAAIARSRATSVSAARSRAAPSGWRSRTSRRRPEGAQREGGGLRRPDGARETRRAGRSDPHAGAALQPRLRPARGSLLPALPLSDVQPRARRPRSFRFCSGARCAPEGSLKRADRRTACQPSNRARPRSTLFATSRACTARTTRHCLPTRSSSASRRSTSSTSSSKLFSQETRIFSTWRAEHPGSHVPKPGSRPNGRNRPFGHASHAQAQPVAVAAGSER